MPTARSGWRMRTFGAGLLMLLAAAFAACGGAEPAPEAEAAAPDPDNPLNLIEPGVLRVGTEPSYPPFEMKAADGSIIGFDVEIARRFADWNNLELVWVESEFDGLIPALQTGKIDMVMSGMTITPEREMAVDFSEPYYEVGQVVMINNRIKDEVQGSADLNDPKYKIAVQTATTGHFAAQEFMPLAQLLQFGSSVECANAVRIGEADAMIFDDPLVRIFAAENPDRVTAFLEPFTRENIGIAVREGNRALLDAVNEHLEYLEENAEMLKLRQEWFVTLAWKDLQ